jgi:hypothetical protein
MHVDLRSEAGRLAVLRLIGEQGAIPVSQLGRFLGLELAEADAFVTGLVDAGWARRRRLLVGDEEWVSLRVRGVRVVDLRGGSPRLKPVALDHLRAINEVRMLLEASCPDGRWEGERRLQRVLGSGVHLPDAVFEVDGERHAIEVELTPKSRARLAQTIAEHSSRYDAVVYFGTGATVPRVEEAVAAGGYQNVFAREVPGPRSWSAAGRSFDRWADGSRRRGVSDRSVGRSGELRRLLSLLAEQGPVSVDHLGRFLDHDRGELQDLLDEAVAERLVREAAVVEGEPAWVWPTRRGMNRCGSDLHPPIPRVGGARLMRATNEARLYIESRSPQAVWVSRRRLFRIHGSRTSQPRGVVELGSERHAVCVELAQLPSDLLVDRYAGRCEEYDAVVVFCAGTVGERLEGLAARWGWRNLRVVDLPGTVRRRRGGRRPDKERLSLEEIERRVRARLEGEAPEGPGGFVAVFGEEVRERLGAARSAPAERVGIEELADAVGITASTIRVYQQLGMVRPPRVDGGAGWYDAEHRETLELIADLRSRRVSRAAIRELLMACRGVVEVRGDERLTLEELCDRVVISSWAVSWLIRAGALQRPSVIDGSECFGAEHLRRLLTVQEMRAAGFRVGKIVSYFSGRA